MQIIGTAGHVDHGKTSLVKAITGIDTDRLKEEQRRGITIELGFAYMGLPNGTKAGIVDVPGHERLIKNMLAGAGSIDLALLVIAADEGPMPQTVEHLDILSLLGVRRGVIVISKSDLVDSEWLSMLTLEAQDLVKGGFLEDAPIIPVSVKSGQGLDELKSTIYDILCKCPQKPISLPFRLPIDRVFTMGGFGTVVTGTLIEGSLALGGDVMLYPSGKTSRARRIQVHNEEHNVAVAGQRAAINLAGLAVGDIQRGDVLAAPNSMNKGHMLDVAIELVKGCKREVVNNSRLHLYHGSGSMLCKISLYDREVLRAGEKAYCTLRLAKPLAAKPLDRFVLRFYSPMETIGGGKILDPLVKAKRRRAAGDKALEALAIKDVGGVAERLALFIKEHSEGLPTIDFIQNLYFANDDISGALSGLIEAGEVFKLDESLVHNDYIVQMGKKTQAILSAYHKANELKVGMPPAELVSHLHKRGRQFEGLMAVLERAGYIYRAGKLIAHADFKIKKSHSDELALGFIMAALHEGGFAPPNMADISSGFTQKHPKERRFNQALAALIDGGEVIMLTKEVFVTTDAYNKAVELFKTLHADGDVTLAAFRNAINSSRKYALAFLEHFDKSGLTKMVGDARRLKI